MEKINFYRIGRALTHFETYGFRRIDIYDSIDISKLLKSEGSYVYVINDKSTFKIKLILVSTFKRTDISNFDEYQLENFNNLVDYDIRSMMQITKIFFNNENIQTHIDKEYDNLYCLRDKHTNLVLSNFSFVVNEKFESFIGSVFEEPLFETLIK